jgi:hypothetical protein
MYTGPALDKLLCDNPTIAEDLRRQDETIGRMIARAKAEQVGASAPAITPAPKRKRRVSQRQLARLAKAEGVEVKLALDGTVTMTPIKPVDITTPTDDTSGNEWDRLLQ